MDNRCVAVFDSGLGGLTAVKEIIRRIGSEDIVYFGDTGRVPYGTRSQDIILKYVRQDIRFLQRFNPKVIVAACGTASSVALPALTGETETPLLGVVEAASRAAARKTRNGKIGILGTPGTIRSGAYEAQIRRHLPDAALTSVACPMFVPLVENGYLERDNPVARLVAQEYLAPLQEAGVDTIILGCTHYPLLKPVLSDIIERETTLVDPGQEVAVWLEDMLRQRDMLRDVSNPGARRYFVSDSVENFSAIGGLFLGGEIGDEVHKIEIEQI